MSSQPPELPACEIDAFVAASRLALAPFRSRRAALCPQRAAARLVRVLVTAAGCAFARCEIAPLHAVQAQGRRNPDGPLQRCRVRIHGAAVMGCIEVIAAPAQLQQLQPDLLQQAQRLGQLCALHQALPAAAGAALDRDRLHTLANQANSLGMQLNVVQALYRRGRYPELAGFLDTALARCEAMQELVAALRQR
ncbi:hypothetical protein [Tahibacter harae]|uniref:hypothetical protein n=1 Tax=Tahibacter harae TaxID=2963937 RepID=UPI0034E07654